MAKVILTEGFKYIGFNDEIWLHFIRTIAAVKVGANKEALLQVDMQFRMGEQMRRKQK